MDSIKGKGKQKKSKDVLISDADGKVHCMTEEISSTCQTIKDILSDCPDCTDPIPLKNVSGQSLQDVIEFASYHIANPDTYALDEYKSDDICSWDVEFFARKDMDSIFLILLDSNFLAYEELVETLCKLIASKIKNMTPREIMETFNIEPEPEKTDKKSTKPKANQKPSKKKSKVTTVLASTSESRTESRLESGSESEPEEDEISE